MKTVRLIHDILEAYRVRCKFWTTCSVQHCNHHGPHYATNDCKFNSPVKYCPQARGFVYDIPYIDGRYANDECDPNLAFKAKRDAERRHNA